jgi:hypothetical protein
MGAGQSAGAVVRLKDGRTRRFRSKQERRQIVEETLKPGSSVSPVARAHEVNANQVFKWRRQYQQGRLEVDANESRFTEERIRSGSNPLAATESFNTHGDESQFSTLHVSDPGLASVTKL